MATVTYSNNELCKLAGKKISLKDMEENITMIGMPVDEVTKEGELVIDVTPNRLDLLSIEGMARAVSSFAGVKKGLRNYEAKAPGKENKIDVDKSVDEVRPFIVSAIVSGIKVDDEILKALLDFQEKLHGTFGRKRKKIAIGVHDLSKVKLPLKYAAVKPESVSFVPLDKTQKMNLREILEKHEKGKEYAGILEKAKNYPLITDANGEVVSFPPIINADKTKVAVGTKELLIEMTGTNERALNEGLNVLCCALADRGGKITQMDCGGKKTPNLAPGKRNLKISEVNDLLGTKIGDKQACELLEKMGYGAKVKGKTGELEVLVPAYRNDVLHEVDLIEDVAIAFDYNNIEKTLPSFTAVGGKATGDFLQEMMVGLGFSEVYTNILTNRKQNFESVKLKNGECVEILNPLTEEFTIVRTWLLPSLLAVLRNNKSQPFPQKLFEYGDAEEGGTGKMKKKLACVSRHAKADYSEIKSVLETLLTEQGIKFEIKTFEHPAFFKGRCAQVKVDGKHIGVLGEIDPQVMENFGLDNVELFAQNSPLRKPVAAFEIEI
ncbi:Phenylalanine--tRNA ligase beta subunit [Candidatus Gugararchaeum adminiculabundum]|nr:Phenylalanine--tRNA ligase beta subunit [Candidatus Gugararchaeum adminiculabundum]